MKLKALTLVAAGVMMLSACSNKTEKNCDNADCTATEQTEEVTPAVVYVGVLPAADAEGMEYTLALTYANDTDGTYALTQKVVGQEVAPFDTEGNFVVMTGTPTDKDAKYLKLTPATTEEATEAPADTLYFLVENDSTVTLVGVDLQKAASDLNYSLNLQK